MYLHQKQWSVLIEKRIGGKNPPVDLGDPYNVLSDDGIPDNDIDPDGLNTRTGETGEPPPCPDKFRKRTCFY